MKLLRLATVILLLIGISACSKDDKGDESKNIDTPDPEYSTVTTKFLDAETEESLLPDTAVSYELGETVTRNEVFHEISSYVLNAELSTEKIIVADIPSLNIFRLYYDKIKAGNARVSYWYFFEKAYGLPEEPDEVYDTQVKIGDEIPLNEEIINGHLEDKYVITLDEDNPVTVSANIEENIIKIYHYLRLADVTYEYYVETEDGMPNVPDKKETVKIKVTLPIPLGDAVLDKHKPEGLYKRVTEENCPTEVSVNEENNIVRIYYHSLNGEVTYRYFIQTLEDGMPAEPTHIVKEPVEINTPVPLTSEILNRYVGEPGKYTVKVEDDPPGLVSCDPQKNIVDIYYELNDVWVTYRYFVDTPAKEEFPREPDSTHKITGRAGSEISLAESLINLYLPDTEKYDVEVSENAPVTISAIAEQNIVDVYYRLKKREVVYQYYIETDAGYKGSPDYQHSLTLKVGSQIPLTDEIKSKFLASPDTYDVKTGENVPAVVSLDPANNIVNIYYALKDKEEWVRYEYYHEDFYGNFWVAPDDTERIKMEIGDEIPLNYDIIAKYLYAAGFSVRVQDNPPSVVRRGEENNVVKIYYDRRSFTISVYEKCGEKIINDYTETHKYMSYVQIKAADHSAEGYVLDGSGVYVIDMVVNDETIIFTYIKTK